MTQNVGLEDKLSRNTVVLSGLKQNLTTYLEELLIKAEVQLLPKLESTKVASKNTEAKNNIIKYTHEKYWPKHVRNCST